MDNLTWMTENDCFIGGWQKKIGASPPPKKSDYHLFYSLFYPLFAEIINLNKPKSKFNPI